MNTPLPINIPPYLGTLDQNKLAGHEKAAYRAWANQCKRCYGKNDPRYKDNGAKGIEVYYSSRDFVAWYLHHIKCFKGKDPSVGRIDHSKGYTFDNIEIQSLAENSLERIHRCGPTKPRRRVFILNADTREKLMICESLSDAAKYTGVQTTHIPKYCRNEIKKSAKGFSFEYV